MNPLEYSILFFAVILGGVIAVLSPKYQKHQVSIILAFAAAYLLGIIATHLLPGVFYPETGSQAGLFLLGGFLIQLLLENLSQGIEHGHFHKEKTHGGQFYAILLGLCLHAILEGLPLSGYQELSDHGHHHHTDFNHFLAGIAIHHIPAAYVLALLMKTHLFPRSRFWLVLLLFAIMTRRLAGRTLVAGCGDGQKYHGPGDRFSPAHRHDHPVRDRTGSLSSGEPLEIVGHSGGYRIIPDQYLTSGGVIPDPGIPDAPEGQQHWDSFLPAG